MADREATVKAVTLKPMDTERWKSALHEASPYIEEAFDFYFEDVRAEGGGVVGAYFNGADHLKSRLLKPITLSVPVLDDGGTIITFTLKQKYVWWALLKAESVDAPEDELPEDSEPVYEVFYYNGEPYEDGREPDPTTCPGAFKLEPWGGVSPWQIVVKPITVPVTGTPLDGMDVLTAAAVALARERGDEDLARRIWSAYYGLEYPTERAANAVLTATTGSSRSARVKTRVLATSDVAHRLPFETEFTEIRTANNAENDIITRTTVGLPDGVTTGRPIDQTGVNVLNSALSHWMAGVTEVSEAKFCKFVYGTTEKPGSETLARMAAQVESLMVTPVTIEKTEELSRTGLPVPDGERDYVKTVALHAEIFMRESANGRIARWYRFIEPPALLRGAAESNQLGSISQVAYERIMDGLRCTELNVNIANYLIRRCSEITNSKKHGKKLSPMVSYQTLYRDVTGDDWGELDRHAQKRVRDAVWHVMDGLQAEHRFYQWWEYRNTGDGAGRGERLTTTHKTERPFKQGKRNVKRPWFETARKAGCEKKRADGIQIQTAAPSKQRKLTGAGGNSK